ncbi:phenylalanine--tRNA ligase subunit beta [Schlesneria paludicola]|uniref:phenylalanine--tRNA ligase subunit beta n=1 Tax=Schlesneria paludicola TaxID=360056 RepID=UPI00029A1023|nr:phenylalanine--tRNA ligase subunit beta [Schlesneria paludicola]
MLVSWNWLKEYVSLDVPVAEFADRLTMAGLNLEEFHAVGSDTCIDFEVTSNRPDCLGHLGIAREAAVLYQKPLKVPAASPKGAATKTASVTSVSIECPDLCSQYYARVIRGVKVGPSPAWLVDRLKTVGIGTINNIVDITNYVLMECGQPLHAFDLQTLHGHKIVVRRARAGEKLQAIDHKEYALTPEMCIIADADRPVAIAGVMGGAETELTFTTKAVLIEAALFSPLAIRNASRKLKLRSDSSYRFERALDPQGPDWASRRCCELILEIAGGELLDEPVFAGVKAPSTGEVVTLRFPQLKRILGIDVLPADAVRILEALGLKVRQRDGDRSVTFEAPTNRRDLSREVDLIEEVIRIHGYDKIPSDANVPLCASMKRLEDRVGDRVRETLTAAGFFEALTVSLVSEFERTLFTPRGSLPPLTIEHSDFPEFSRLRQSLIPSLLVSRRENERHGQFDAQLFELARVYVSADKSIAEAQAEPRMVSFVSGRSFQELKGVVEQVALRMNPNARVQVRPSECPQFVAGRGAEVILNDQPWGWLGELDRAVTGQLDLRDAVTVAELDLRVLEQHADLVPKFRELPTQQASARDLNFVLDEQVTWAAIEEIVRKAGGPLLESVSFGGQYRGKQIPEGKKSYLLTLAYRADRTLTSEEVEEAQKAVIAACASQLSATLRA